MKKFLSACLCIVIAFTAASCNAAPSRYSATFTDVFDTVTEFTAYCDSKDVFDTAADEIHGELVRLHRLFDIYNEYDGITNLAVMNRLCADGPITVDDDIIAVLDIGKRYFDLSQGKLNIALGSVLSIWHEYREEGVSVPDYEELRNASLHTDINDVIIDGNTVRFADKELKLDAGAIAKGYAANIAANIAKVHGLTDFALNPGGNVITCGKKPSGKWSIGVRDPQDGIFTTVKVSDTSVVTSGDYQRFYEVDGVEYHHIIDTDTLFPANLYRSVTVICADGAVSDALSTALFCMDIESGKKLAKEHNAQALWIYANGECERTEGFAEYE